MDKVKGATTIKLLTYLLDKTLLYRNEFIAYRNFTLKIYKHYLTLLNVVLNVNFKILKKIIFSVLLKIK